MYEIYLTETSGTVRTRTASATSPALRAAEASDICTASSPGQGRRRGALRPPGQPGERR